MGGTIGNHARSRVKHTDAPIEEGPSRLAFVLAVTFLGSVSGGVFWIGIFFVTLRHYRFSESENLGLALAYLPANPARSEPEVAAASVGREYPLLLRSASALLPLSYLMSSTLSPVLPHRLEALGPSIVPASMIAATWMVARWLTLVVMARLTFWHGRWGALFAAFVALTSGLGVVLLAPSVTGLALGLLLFGVGMGISYFATLYYSLSVGHGAVDAGGGFEALVGLGYVLGPLVGLAGQAFDSGANSVTVVLTWVCALVGGVLSLRPYRTARIGRG